MVTKKSKILVTDDDSDLRTVLMDKLELSGFEVFGAVDGEDGLNKALTMHPDLILLDGLMPKLGGWDVLERLRQDEWGKTARVIMLTVLEDVEHIAKAMEKGSFLYLIKTNHSLDDVVKQVESALNGRMK